YFNARSIKNKLADLHYVLYNINAPSVILICETWLNKSIVNSMLDPDCVYDIYCKDRCDKSGGGVLIFVNRNLNSVPIDEVGNFPLIECTGFDINVGFTLRFILFYRPPGFYDNDFTIMSQVCDCILA